MENSNVIIEAYWEGPFSVDDLKDFKNNDDFCLYQIYGPSNNSSSDSLLYIGKIEDQKAYTRLVKQHTWIEDLGDECKIFLSTCSSFTNWENRSQDDRDRYPKYNSQLNMDISLGSIEALLIYAHDPLYNIQNKNSRKSDKTSSFGALEFSVFNTWRRKFLFPEISTTYYRDKK